MVSSRYGYAGCSCRPRPQSFQTFILAHHLRLLIFAASKRCFLRCATDFHCTTVQLRVPLISHTTIYPPWPLFSLRNSHRHRFPSHLLSLLSGLSAQYKSWSCALGGITSTLHFLTVLQVGLSADHVSFTSTHIAGYFFPKKGAQQETPDRLSWISSWMTCRASKSKSRWVPC